MAHESILRQAPARSILYEPLLLRKRSGSHPARNNKKPLANANGFLWLPVVEVLRNFFEQPTEVDSQITWSISTLMSSLPPVLLATD